MQVKYVLEAYLDSLEMERWSILKKDNTRCIQCGEEFNDSNTFTEEGWGETEISGLCEQCFDNLFEDEE